MAKKKKHTGHFCKICHTYKANEKFSGKGHAKHICKVCSRIPAEKRKEMETAFMNTFEVIYRDEEVDLPFEPEHSIISLDGYDDDFRAELEYCIEDELTFWMIRKGGKPNDKQQKRIFDGICKEFFSIYTKTFEPDDELKGLFDTTLTRTFEQLEKEELLEP